MGTGHRAQSAKAAADDDDDDDIERFKVYSHLTVT
jgi:hypothetical protein